MGLIKNDGYNLKGVNITPAYAKITKLFVDDTIARAYFGISNSRKNLEANTPIDEIYYECEINRSNDEVFKDVYTKAKQDIFTGWQDDIVKE